MLFINWLRLQLLIVGAFIIAGSVWAFQAVKAKRALVRLPLRILSAITVGIISPTYLLFCFAALLSYTDGCDTHGAPIYSPDSKQAVRIENTNEGATGGETTVRLYTLHGFSTTPVFYGGWQSTQQKDVRWLSNSELEIRYSGAYSHCKSTRKVHVRCLAEAPKPAYPNHPVGVRTEP